MTRALRMLTRPRDCAPELVAIGASAGGFDALLALLQDLPAGFTMPVVVVLHLPPRHESRLAHVFAARLRVPVQEAQARAPVARGTIHFAPPGYHLLVESDCTFSLSCEPPVMFSRPSIDVLLEACADAYGEALAAMVLTGANEDGAQGLAHVKARGGLALAQDPAEAQHATMPQAAIRVAQPHAVLRLGEMTALLHTWGSPR